MHHGENRNDIYRAMQLLPARPPSRRIMALLEVAASGISSTKADMPMVMKGRLRMSWRLPTSRKLINQRLGRQVQHGVKEHIQAEHRRSRSSQCQPVSLRSGETVR